MALPLIPLALGALVVLALGGSSSPADKIFALRGKRVAYRAPMVRAILSSWEGGFFASLPVTGRPGELLVDLGGVVNAGGAAQALHNQGLDLYVTPNVHLPTTGAGARLLDVVRANEAPIDALKTLAEARAAIASPSSGRVLLLAASDPWPLAGTSPAAPGTLPAIQIPPAIQVGPGGFAIPPGFVMPPPGDLSADPNMPPELRAQVDAALASPTITPEALDALAAAADLGPFPIAAAKLRAKAAALRALHGSGGAGVVPPPGDAGPWHYVVQPNDFPSAIAKKLIGAAARWKELRDANVPPKKIQTSGPQAGNFTTLFAGETLLLPDSWGAILAAKMPNVPAGVLPPGTPLPPAMPPHVDAPTDPGAPAPAPAAPAVTPGGPAPQSADDAFAAETAAALASLQHVANGGTLAQPGDAGGLGDGSGFTSS